MEGERTYTVSEVAERLQLHQQTVREWLRTGKIKGVRLGGTKAGWRIPDSEVARVSLASYSEAQQQIAALQAEIDEYRHLLGLPLKYGGGIG